MQQQKVLAQQGFSKLAPCCCASLLRYDAKLLIFRVLPCACLPPLQLLPYLQAKGVGVISAAPLCMGLWRPQVRHLAMVVSVYT